MQHSENYISINKKLWDERTKHHVGSEFYNHNNFLQGASTLNEIELNLLGDIKGKTILHLQCHFGQDSLSLARMGATVTGIDFSTEAIKIAKEANEQLKQNATFICCDLYSLPQHLDKQFDIEFIRGGVKIVPEFGMSAYYGNAKNLDTKFDIVFTSYGTIGWLPDMKAWANIVAKFLKPNGSFVFVEFHPVVWMLDNNFSQIAYSYFNREPIIENEQGTYAEKDAPLQLQSIGWNHSLHEVMQNLLDVGLSLQSFEEFDYSPYNIFSETTAIEKTKFMIKGLEHKIPLVYSLKMKK